MPDWPVNDKPSPASVVWDATGLRINASNSSLQQILSEVSTETGTKVEGMGADQRVYGVYGPGQARDVLSQLLQGSGYNVLLAGDIGQGAPRADRTQSAPERPHAVRKPMNQSAARSRTTTFQSSTGRTAAASATHSASADADSGPAGLWWS